MAKAKKKLVPQSTLEDLRTRIAKQADEVLKIEGVDNVVVIREMHCELNALKRLLDTVLM